MPELGDTDDPKALVPGNPASIRQTSWSMTVYGDLLHEAGTGLRRIDTTNGWSGRAADAFRATFDGEPKKWLQAGDCFHAASTALERYASTLTWAQTQAAEANRLWNDAQVTTRQAAAHHDHTMPQAPADADPIPFTDPGEPQRQAARDTLHRTRTQLAEAGDTAAEAVGAARDQAPDQPSLLQQASTTLTDAAGAIGTAGAHAVNTAASLGNAALHHPESVVATAGGAGLTALSATGEVAGVALDATGVGAVAGIPLNTVSAAGIATGVGITGAGIGNIAYHATGDDSVQPLDTDNTTDPPSQEPTEAGAWDHVEGEKPNPADIHTPETRKIHILDGDGQGNGGHLAGTGVPNKKEFPDTWDDDKVTSEVENVATTPDHPPELQRNGRWAVDGTREGVEIKAIVEKNGQVWTGYPTGGDGVIQNDEHGNPRPN